MIVKALFSVLMMAVSTSGFVTVVEREPVSLPSLEIRSDKSAESYIKVACKEWAKTPKLASKTTKQLDAWLVKAQMATKKALTPAVAASRLNRKWDAFVGYLVILQANMDSLKQSRTFADAKLWDSAVVYLKRTCARMLG
jgi:hypothetical protein